LVKARQKKAMPTSGITINPATKAGQPIAGYFRINPRIMQAKIDDYGNIQQWKQTINNTEKAHKIDDIIHFYYKREAGEIFGMPYIWPALEDVRLLRQLEDNIAVLIYRYAVPIYHFIIGALQPGFEATPEEIDEAKAKINEMPTDGIIITNERTQIKSVGAEGQALDASNYLKYYENRVFTGLGVSQTQMGRGDTANKNTADAIDQQMVDRVKSFQKIMELNITYNVIVELLLEGGFDPINNPDDIVSFKFNEVNIDTQIKLENHIVYKFEHNATTFDEMRESLGLDEADEARLFTNMIGPMAVLDAQASIDAQAETNNLNKPENQNGTRQSPKTSPRREFKEAFSQNQHKQTYYTFMNDISDATDEKSISLIASSATNLIVRSIASGCLNDIQRAANDVKIEKSLPGDVIISYEKVLNIIETELKSDVYGLLMDVATKPGNRKAVFDTNAYRLDFAERYWTSKAYNIAKLEAYKQVGVTNIQILGADETDRVCYPQNGEMEVKLYTTKNIPPFHSGCKCYIKAKE
jgi:hypothetical protein